MKGLGNMPRTTLWFALTALCALAVAPSGWADVPAPPVNQDLGMFDGLIGDMQEADCRMCHDANVPNRHHLLNDQPIPPGSLVPYPDADRNGQRDTIYGCLNCHDVHFSVVRDCTSCHTTSPHHTTPAASGGDCADCHGSLVNNMNDGHYIPDYAPSMITPSPSGGEGLPTNNRGNGSGACNYCHDDDGQAAPMILDNATLHHNAASNCLWCHETNPMSFHTDREDDAMHAPGKKRPFTNGCTDCHGADLRGGVARSCYSCHGREWEGNDSGSGHSPYFSTADDMRKCEGCHGPESLHNIQADSPNTANLGSIVVGAEFAGFGHVGRDVGPGDSDCWGCHGFSMASSAPFTGPLVPTLHNTSVSSLVSGKSTSVLLTGAAFSNSAAGQTYAPSVKLTSHSGDSLALTPDLVTDQGTLAVTVPASIPAGNYFVRVVKGDVESNPLKLMVVPNVAISSVQVNGTLVTIAGSGFGGFASGSGTKVTAVAVNGRTGRLVTIDGVIKSWSNGRIEANFRYAPKTLTVTSVFGTATRRLSR